MGHPYIAISKHISNDSDDDFYYFPFETGDLTKEPSFSKVYIDPHQYLQYYQLLMDDIRLNPRSKVYAVFAMQNINYKSYLDVVRMTFNSYKKGKIPHQVLHLVIVNGFGWSNTIRDHHYNPEVQSILEEIRKWPSLPNTLIKSIDVQLKQ